VAYFDCRRGKRNTLYAWNFEFDLERNLFDLYETLKNETYQISRSIAFVVEQPKIREIWAATFRDRVVHHVIYNRLAPKFYPGFIRNSFACSPGRGSLDGSSHLWAGMRSLTRNWQRPGYYLGADVRNFFVSIHKPTLFEILKPKIPEPWLLNLTSQVLFHDPRINCTLKSTREAFDRVPKHKSLRNTPSEVGLPIGNLTSQFFANVGIGTTNPGSALTKTKTDLMISGTNYLSAFNYSVQPSGGGTGTYWANSTTATYSANNSDSGTGRFDCLRSECG
jgi:hypothetical protein